MQGGRALAHVVIAMAVLGFGDNLIPLISDEHGLAQFHLMRAVGALGLLAVLMPVLGRRWRLLRPGWVGLRSALISLSMVIYFGCLPLMPISQVAAGLFSAPIFVLLAEVVLLRRPFTLRRGAAVALGFAGILMVTGPNGPLTWLSLLPVLAGFLYGMGNLVTRERCLDEDAVVLLAGFFAAMTIWAGLGLALLGAAEIPGESFATRGWTPPGPVLWGVIAVQIVASALSLGLLARAYQIAEASLVAVFENVFLVFASLFAFLFWGQVPGLVAALGMVLIAAGGGIAAQRPRPIPPVETAG